MANGETTDTRADGAPPSWPRPAMALLAVGSAALLGFTLVLVFHNLRYSYARILDILAGAAATPSPDGRIDLTTIVIPDWVAPFMQDLSVVSPALVLFTAARMLVAALLLLRSPATVRRWGNVHFPFPDPYKVYFIQMGLLGTIIGFVIAFAEVDPRAERQSIILLEALGTALWSTLTAIVLAYVFCPAIEAVYARARAQLSPAAPRDTRSALDALRHRTAAAAGELDTLAASTRLLAEESRALGAELRDRRLDSRVARLAQDLEAMAGSIDDLRAQQQATLARQHALESEHRALAARLDAGEHALEKQAADLATTSSTLAPLPAAVADLDAEAERSRAARARLTALETWLRTAPRETTDG